ncbi:acyl-CoA dehydrogenase C-terminal domain-containing protein [Paracoccaceae bacterium]|nr:acyl-CoA dehydrogenase C-terminal domain-containing protein [Paracoccaceae bacterium]
MHSYQPPLEDFNFILHNFLKIEKEDIKGYKDLLPEFTRTIFEEAGKLASEVISPSNRDGDEQGCKLENGIVRTPDSFKPAFDKLREGGWLSLDIEEEYGGQNLPLILSTVTNEMFTSANMSLTMYSGLSRGAYSAIFLHGSEEQKQLYLPKLASCEWTGTMNLTEPHCGTDLGLIRTKATRNGNGSYQVSGQKIFISSGDHDLSKNIIHLVLAKTPEAPEGVKGISLFVVPKFLVNDDGSLGERNKLSVGKIEKKMGIKGNATCVMNYDGAKGYLVGEENKGLRAMFTMMNEARLGVGMQGLAQAEIAYQAALAYAKDRRQGRAILEKAEPNENADAIIVHPDVRRNLMEQKSFIEGARGFIAWAAVLLDKAKREQDKNAEGIASLLIPVIKGYVTDKGFEYTINAQQVFGGHGYIEEWGMSQYARDCRIAMIYEGTNGIQALDLVGRKLATDGGKHMREYLNLIQSFIKEDHAEDFSLDFIAPLKKSIEHLQTALTFFMQNGLKNPLSAVSGATDFLHLVGLVSLGFIWSKKAQSAREQLNKSETNEEFLKAKILTGSYFMNRQLPETKLRLDRVLTGEKQVMSLTTDQF